MSSFRTLAAGAVLLAVSACGFRPLYAPPAEDRSGQSVYAFDAMQAVEIGLIPDRSGQYLRNKLVRLIHPEGKSAASKYALTVTFSESRAELDVQQSAIATRANLIVTANYQVTDLVSGVGLGSGNVRSTSGFNIFDSEFQTLVAEQGARERALDAIAEQIRVRLAILLTQKTKPGN